MKIFVLALALIIAESGYSTAQWKKIKSIPTQEIVALALYGDTILAASGTNLLYKSIDYGFMWIPVKVSRDNIAITTLDVIGNKIFIGTADNGIYYSADNGLTWKNEGSNLLTLSGLAEFGNDIFAATLGNGVYIYDKTANTWYPFNNSLPAYSVNVFTIISTHASLLINAGANGTYYRYDFNKRQWNEEYYYGLLRPGLMIDNIAADSITVFAVNGNRIIRSDNDGLSWADDNSGTHDGISRNICIGTSQYFAITNLLNGGTWIQQRSKLSSTGSVWTINEEYISGGYSYDILEFGNKLFLARADGLYVKNRALSIDNAISEAGF